MPKAQPRTTADPLGRKLLQVLREQGHADDLVYLAAQFDVRVQSVYDWINHGRLAKDRFGQLVAWSGRSLHWWFDLPEPGGAALLAQEPTPQRVTAGGWPFARITLAQVLALSPADRLRLEGAMLAILAQLGQTPGGAFSG